MTKRASFGLFRTGFHRFPGHRPRGQRSSGRRRATPRTGDPGRPLCADVPSSGGADPLPTLLPVLAGLLGAEQVWLHWAFCAFSYASVPVPLRPNAGHTGHTAAVSVPLLFATRSPARSRILGY